MTKTSSGSDGHANSKEDDDEDDDAALARMALNRKN
jgi:hypothetical protein